MRVLRISEAERHQLVVGSQARILYANAAARCGIAAAINAAVASGALSGPVMLSRDHHDVSGTDSPWRWEPVGPRAHTEADGCAPTLSLSAVLAPE